MINLQEYVNKVKKGEINVSKYMVDTLKKLKKINKEYHYMNVISEELALKQTKNFNKKGKLAGVPVTLKDAICAKDMESCAGSKILKGYKPVFNATVVQKIIDEGGIIIGKTSQDEFGFGGFSVNMGVGYEKPLNPFDKARACGGSSGGSAGLTKKADFVHISLGESTGGSIVNPASFCGVYGLCPTYGRVSRYGLIDYGNSLDKIGPMGKSIYDVALTLEVISGYDKKDSTSVDVKNENFTGYLKKDVKNLKIGIIKEAFGKGTNNKVIDSVNSGIKLLKENGCKISEVSLNLPIKYGIPVYYLIATSEASTNLAKYCGMRYGYEEKISGSFNEYFTKIRSENLGLEAKRRIMLGTFARMAGFRDAFYLKAMKIRTKIVEEYEKLFSNYDVLISPTVPILPPRFDEIKKLNILENYMIDVLTVGPNLAGLPHLNVPVKEVNKLPVGMMITGNHFEEGKVLQVGKEV